MKHIYFDNRGIIKFVSEKEVQSELKHAVVDSFIPQENSIPFYIDGAIVFEDTPDQKRKNQEELNKTALKDALSKAKTLEEIKSLIFEIIK